MRLTTAFEARRRIITLLQAQSGLSGVLVTRGAPTEEIASGRELIYFEPTEDDFTAEWGAIGGGRRDEDYILQLVVWVFQEGDDEAATEARCETLCDEVAAALDADRYLNSELDHALLVQVGGISTDPVAQPKGWRCVTTVRLGCRAGIRP